MARLLKRWESPRREGRNDKGRGGSARQRQLKKQQQMLRKKLKDNNQGRENLFLFCCQLLLKWTTNSQISHF